MLMMDNIQILRQKARLKYAEVMGQREHIVEAFIAETGLFPSEIEQIEQHHDNGNISWYLRKREIDE